MPCSAAGQQHSNIRSGKKCCWNFLKSTSTVIGTKSVKFKKMGRFYNIMSLDNKRTFWENRDMPNGIIQEMEINWINKSESYHWAADRLQNRRQHKT